MERIFYIDVKMGEKVHNGTNYTLWQKSGLAHISKTMTETEFNEAQKKIETFIRQVFQ